MNNRIYRKIKGFRDIFGNEIYYWHIVEDKFKKIFSLYGYEEVKLPVIERVEVFNKGLGDTSDIVDKEMFSFIDKDNKTVALRPEGTASVARFYIENGLFNDNKVDKFYYYGPMFRRENPQKGRFRQFYQVGVEAIGSSSALLDSEVIKLFSDFFDSFNTKLDIRLEINSIGCQMCRQSYIVALSDYLKEESNNLCENCNNKLQSNPLRVLDCKNIRCRDALENAPKIDKFLCGECKNHFQKVKDYLNRFNINFLVNLKLVRGLDYYMRTAFEMITDHFGPALAIGAGGRYDGLIKQLGGPDVPGIGFAIGIDRLVTLLKEVNEISGELKFFIAYQNSNQIDSVICLLKELRENYLNTITDFDGKNLKNQLKMANKYSVDYVIILGDDEIKGQYVTIKNMKNGEQYKFSRENVAIVIKNKFINGGVNCFQ